MKINSIQKCYDIFNQTSSPPTTTTTASESLELFDNDTLNNSDPIDQSLATINDLNLTSLSSDSGCQTIGKLSTDGVVTVSESVMMDGDTEEKNIGVVPVILTTSSSGGGDRGDTTTVADSSAGETDLNKNCDIYDETNENDEDDDDDDDSSNAKKTGSTGLNRSNSVRDRAKALENIHKRRSDVFDERQQSPRVIRVANRFLTQPITMNELNKSNTSPSDDSGTEIGE